mmetsp:Transcript_36888/g.92503  ORF Transcript_36888/g.92503 Transcript_36888/m.92503 type:complete len:122 (+) Transcript_36888:630-995(+)
MRSGENKKQANKPAPLVPTPSIHPSTRPYHACLPASTIHALHHTMVPDCLSCPAALAAFISIRESAGQSHTHPHPGRRRPHEAGHTSSLARTPSLCGLQSLSPPSMVGLFGRDEDGPQMPP